MSAAARIELGTFPTPLEQSPELGRVLGVADLWIKRDDLTGFSWGGNKVRTIEFILGDAISQGADCLIICGGPTSNFAALLASACARLGIAIHQISYGEPPRREPAALCVSLNEGATVTFTGSQDRASVDLAARTLVDDMRAKGRRPYLVPRGGATAIGALGYAFAAAEIRRQVTQLGLSGVTVVIPVGSGGTITGLISGSSYDFGSAFGSGHFELEIVGVCVSRSPDALTCEIDTMAKACAGGRGESRSVRCRWSLVDGRRTGFGVSDRQEDEFVDDVRRRTGLLIDSTYNGKAMMWLREAAHRPAGPVVYWHTGGLLGVVDKLAIQRTRRPAAQISRGSHHDLTWPRL